MSGSKEKILTQIRAALDGGRPAAVPEALPPFYPRTDTAGAGRLVGQFSSELEKVGGRVVRVQSFDELKEDLASLLRSDIDAPIAVSDGEVLRRLGIKEWLVRAGRRVLPPFREFVSLKQNGEGSQFGEATPKREEAGTMDAYKRVLIEASVGITSADYALADTGTLVLVSGGEQHRLISLLPPVHVCLLDSDRIFASLTDLLAHLHGQFCAPDAAPQNMTCITGPSRTADIEHTITLGVHGPRALHVFLYSTND
jgi:L-lactate dehydrogenase complex protein LldG